MIESKCDICNCKIGDFERDKNVRYYLCGYCGENREKWDA